MMSRKTILYLIVLCISHFSYSQPEKEKPFIPLPFSEYLDSVAVNNLGYIAAKLNIPMSEATIEMAKIFPDPIITMGAFDNGQKRLKTGYGFSMSVTRTIELGGKRKARVNLANSQRDLSQALLADYFRNLRADASINFLQALRQELILEVKKSSYESIKELAEATQKRFELGVVMEIDAIQSKVEAGMFLNDIYKSSADYKSAKLSLAMFLGQYKPDTLYRPIGNLKKADREFNLSTIIIEALNNRADLLAALKNKETSANTLKLIKANRVMNVDVQMYNNYNSRISNIIEPTPSYNSVGVGVAIPLKFSNKYTGDLKMAELQIQQADLLYRETDIQINVEVSQAYYQYLGNRRQVKEFELGLLDESRKVLLGKIYSYKRGETSLLEVLNAQRNYNEVQISYYDAVYNYASSLVELERTIGIWDIDF